MARDGGGGTLHTRPSTNLAVPADNRVHDAGVVLDLGVLEDDGLLDADAGADDAARADRHVGADLGGGVHLRGGVDVHGGNDVSGGLCELLGAGLEGLCEVEGVCGDGGAGRLDLAPEVLGLEDEELAAVCDVGEDVLLEADDGVLLVFFVFLAGVVGGVEVLGGGVGEEAGALGAALDGAADGGEDALGGEEVDTAVDEVGDLTLWLLDVVEDALRVGVRHDAAEVAGRLARDSGAQHDGLGVLVLEQLEHVVERERRADVGVEHEEPVGLALEDHIAEVVETACGAQCLIFSEVLDGELGEAVGDGVDEGLEDGFLVVADDEDLLDLGDVRNGTEAVLDDGVTGDGEEGLLWVSKC